MIGLLYAESLKGAAVEIEHADGTRRPLDSARWLRPAPGDEAILSQCLAPVLDIGCGPGRFTVELARRAVPTLGIDITPYAVHLTRRAGGLVLCCDVFGPVVGSGHWATVLLADGNIGIGGDPHALLRRVRELVRPGGQILTEVEPPGVVSRVDRLRLRGLGLTGDWFTWARVSVTDFPSMARSAGFTEVDSWQADDRWFARLH
ncbi:methyltransferase domain-containing protein [Streptosporangium sp. NPDC002544]|uniref:methyltransferase domain-containing protein n=1 Tax=Streptosporangium sp. NPDC002544 TaxID=3154538 RepID=UPI003320308E